MNRVTATLMAKAIVMVSMVVMLAWFSVAYLMPLLEHGDQVGGRHRRMADGGIIALSVLWLTGWWYVLYGESQEGIVFRTTVRGNHIVLGLGMIAITVLLAYAVVASAER